jgi:hypothetical protein
MSQEIPNSVSQAVFQKSDFNNEKKRAVKGNE